MPIPAYIICSQRGSEDVSSGTISLTNIIEKIHFTRVATPGARPLELQVTAAWIRTPQDAGRTFEYSLNVFLPPGDVEIPFGVWPFTFSSDYQRISLRLAGFGFQASGTMRVVVGLRETGSQEWNNQTYPILVEDVTPVAQPSQLQTIPLTPQAPPAAGGT